VTGRIHRRDDQESLGCESTELRDLHQRAEGVAESTPVAAAGRGGEADNNSAGVRFEDSRVRASRRVVRLIDEDEVVVAGAAGVIYNFNSVTSPPASGALAATPATVGIYSAGMVFTSGLVVVPGAGQSVNVTYSLGGVDAVNQRA
jgi:hypothetical protein